MIEWSLYNEGLSLKSFHLESIIIALKRVENRWHFGHRVPTLSMYEGADTPTAIAELCLKTNHFGDALHI